MSPRPARCQEFLMDPERWRHDPAVLAMSDEARGCYAMLFMAGWALKEPGVYPATDSVLCNLAMTTPETWARVRESVAAAFDTSRRPGAWVLPGMVETRAAQSRLAQRRKKAGRAGGIAKRDNEIVSQALADRHTSATSQALADRHTSATSKTLANSANVHIGVDSESKTSPPEEEATPPQHSASSTSVRPVRKITEAQIAAAAARDWPGPNGQPVRLPIETVRLLAQRIRLEMDHRGYRSAPSALLKWCRIEAGAPVARPPGPGEPQPAQEPRDGEIRAGLVWWAGGWRIPDTAEFLGWTREAITP